MRDSHGRSFIFTEKLADMNSLSLSLPLSLSLSFSLEWVTCQETALGDRGHIYLPLHLVVLWNRSCVPPVKWCRAECANTHTSQKLIYRIYARVHTPWTACSASASTICKMRFVRLRPLLSLLSLSLLLFLSLCYWCCLLPYQLRVRRSYEKLEFALTQL